MFRTEQTCTPANAAQGEGAGHVHGIQIREPGQPDGSGGTRPWIARVPHSFPTRISLVEMCCLFGRLAVLLAVDDSDLD